MCDTKASRAEELMMEYESYSIPEDGTPDARFIDCIGVHDVVEIERKAGERMIEKLIKLLKGEQDDE